MHVRYTHSSGSSEARMRISEAVLALVSFVLVFALLRAIYQRTRTIVTLQGYVIELLFKRDLYQTDARALQEFVARAEGDARMITKQVVGAIQRMAEAVVPNTSLFAAQAVIMQR